VQSLVTFIGLGIHIYTMKVSRSALLPYSATQMYAVIIDVRAYPDFLNWCTGIEVLEESNQEMIAKLAISYSRLNLSFTTRNRMCDEQTVTISLVDGPFSSLAGQWTVLALGETACKVSLDMDFAFKNAITHKLVGRIFQKIISAQLEAFNKRAHQLYGERSGHA